MSLYLLVYREILILQVIQKYHLKEKAKSLEDVDIGGEGVFGSLYRIFRV